MLDCVIRGGTVVDGTGRAGFRADVGILGGRVVEIGDVDDAASTTIDATGRVVAPGFVDPHTHLDAQALWDPALAPSALHGVTTVVGGNCGFTIAPIDDASADYVMRMLSCVEGIPVESLEHALDFKWHSFGQWLDRLESSLSLNAGFLVGHSTIRKLVMGEAWREPATAEQVRQMAAVVDESVRAGALGFSSSWSESHADHQGDLVPSRYSDADELVALSGVLRNHPGTVLEFLPSARPVFPDNAVETMARMSAAAQRTLNWNVVHVGTGVSEEQNQSRLAASDVAAARGGHVVALAIPEPVTVRINLLTTISYNNFPTWLRLMGLPPAERRLAFEDRANRVAMAAEVEGNPRVVVQFDSVIVESTSPEQAHLVGRTVGDIATERGCTPLDAFLDIAIADDLRASFRTALVGDDEASWQERARVWNDPRTLVGGSDAGAHTDMIGTFAYFTTFVGPTVRDRGLITLEQAIHKLTDVPARLYGMRGRGRLAEGWWADILVFDPDTIRCGDMELRADLPAGASRLYAEGIGIDHVLVNGVEVVRHGCPTGAIPGHVLRSGRDTMSS